MTVKDLIQELNQMDPDALVVISTDEEGNGYRTANCVTDEYNFDHKTRDVGLKPLSKEEEEDGYSEEDVMVGGVPCVIVA